MKLLFSIVVSTFLATLAFGQSTYHWVGGGTTSTWTDLGNWESPLGTAATNFPNSSTSNVIMDGNTFPLAITIDLDTIITIGSLTITGDSITFSSNDFNFTTDNVTIDAIASTINLGSSAWTLNGTSWNVLPTVDLFLNCGMATFNQTDSVSFDFHGGNYTYNVINFHATTVQITGSNTFADLQLKTGSTLTLEALTTTNFNALTQSNLQCATTTWITSTGATINYTGVGPFSSTNFSFENITPDTSVIQDYFVQNATLINSPLFEPIGQNFYWIGSSNNNVWSDGANWSTSIEGPSYGCIPSSVDTVHITSILSSSTFPLQIDTTVEVASIKIYNTTADITSQNNLIKTKEVSVVSTNGAIYLDSSTWIISNGKWAVETSPSLTINPGTSLIELQDSTLGIFDGGGKTYYDLTIHADSSYLAGDNIFNKLSLKRASTLVLGNGTISTISQITGNEEHCNDRTRIRTFSMAPGDTPAQVRTVGTGDLMFKNFHLQFINIDASTGGRYLLHHSDTIQTSGLIKGGSSYYWINHSGTWLDSNKWSASSNGPAYGCVPTALDTVYFDTHSFSAPGGEVTNVQHIEITSMAWSTNNAHSIKLAPNTSFTTYGDVTLEQQLTVQGAVDSIKQEFIVKGQASLDLSATLFDLDLVVNTNSANDTVKLTQNFASSKENKIAVMSGYFNTNGVSITTGEIYTDTNLTTQATRSIDLGSSSIYLSRGWMGRNASNLNFNAGTSKIHISDSIGSQYLITTALNFNDVYVGYERTNLNVPNYSQFLAGNNTFRKLELLTGTKMSIASTSTQTIIDSLHLRGNCFDSILLITSQAPAMPTFNFQGSAIAVGNAVIINNVAATGATGSLYNSRIVNNTNIWPLDATPTAAINTSNISTQICFGDTLQLNYSYTSNTGNGHHALWYLGTGGQFTIDSVFTLVPSIDTVNVLGKDTIIGSDTTWIPFTNIIPYQTIVTTTAFTIGGNSIVANIYVDNNRNTGYYAVGTTYSPYFTGITEHYYNAGGEYQIVLALQDSVNRCQSYDTINVRVLDPQFTSLPPTTGLTICDGTQVKFNTSQPKSGYDITYAINNQTVVGGSPLLTYDTITTQSENVVYVPHPTIPDQFIGDTLVTTSSLYYTYLTTSALAHGDTVNVYAEQEGCLSSQYKTYVFTVNPLPEYTVVNTPMDLTICLNDTLTLSHQTLNDSLSYNYYINESFAGNGESFTTTELEPNAIVKVIVGRGNVCFDTLTYNITVNNLPTTSLTVASPDLIICDGDEVTFIADNAFEYAYYINDTILLRGWDQDPTFTTSSIQNFQEVSVVGRTPHLCEFTAPETFNYVVNEIPQIGLNTLETLPVCTGTEVHFEASGAIEYAFYLNAIEVQAMGGNNALTLDSVAQNDIITVIGRTNGCTGSVSPLVMQTNQAPHLNVTTGIINNTVCSGETKTFTVTGATDYLFTLNGSPVGTMSPVNTYNHTFNNSAATIAITGAMNGCSITEQFPITVLASPTVALLTNSSNNTICEGEGITFTGTGASEYLLSLNNVEQGTYSTASTYTPALPIGTYPVTIYGKAANGCISPSQNAVLVTVNPLPNPAMTYSELDPIICQGTNVTFTGSGATHYQFFIDNVAQGGLTTNAVFATNNLQNNQSVHLRAMQLGCESNTTPINFVVNQNPTVSLASTDIDNTFCEGSSVIYTASGASMYEFFLGTTSLGSPSATATFDATTLPAGSHVLTVQGTENGCSANEIQQIAINATPTATLSSSIASNEICSGQNVNYTATGGSLYEFFIGNTSQGTGVAPFIATTQLNNGDIVAVKVSTSQGCSDSTAMAPITVNATPVVTLLSTDVDNTICINDLVTYTASGANEYEFFINNISQGAPSASASISSSAFANGTIIKVIGSSLGCHTTTIASPLTVHTYPVVSMINNGTTQVCTNEAVAIEANGATNFLFYVNGIAQGSYSTTATFTNSVQDGDIITVDGELNGCITTAPTQIQYTVHTYPSLLVQSTDADNVICKDQLVEFTSSGAMEYQFTLNGNAVSLGANNIYASDAFENNDVLMITGFNGDCASTTQTFTFTVNEMTLGIATSPSNMACLGETVTFTATGADLYEFMRNGISLGAPNATNTISFNDLLNNDQITFKGTSNATSCVQAFNDYVLMNIMTSPAISALGSIEFCDGDSVVLTSNSPYGNQWILDGTPIAGATNQTLVAFDHGTYTLSVQHGGTGQLWSVGNNASGTFGVGNNFNNINPQVVSGLSFKEVKSGKNHVLAITTDNLLYTWGDNEFGQLGNGTYTNSNSPILSTIPAVKTAATADNSSMAVTTTGALYVWGENFLGQLGTGNNSVINFTYLHPTMTNVDTIVGGKDHFVVLKNDGTVWTTGHNASGQLGNNTLTNSMTFVQVPTLTNVVAIGAGEYSSFAVTATGQLYVWGANSNGQLGMGDLNHRLVPTLSSLKRVASAVGGATHTIFTTTDFKAFATGGNAYGQLGLGDTIQRTLPTEISLPGIRQASAGQYYTVLNRNDNSLFGFGDNTNGQLSFYGNPLVSSPTLIDKMDGVTFVEAGRVSLHAIYGVANECTSPQQNVIVHALPTPVIAVGTNNLLSVAAGATSYQWFVNGSLIPGATNNVYQSVTTGNYTVEVTHGYGCTVLSAQQYVGFLGFEDITEKLQITAYPNPTTGQFNIQISGNITTQEIHLEVLDQAGRTVKNETQQMAIVNSIDLEDLSAGSYQVILTVDGIKTILRAVKVNN